MNLILTLALKLKLRLVKLPDIKILDTDLRYYLTKNNVKKSSGSLEIVRLRPDDEGVYTCTATNIGGTTEKSIRLYVEQEPTVDISSQEKVKNQIELK